MRRETSVLHLERESAPPRIEVKVGTAFKKGKEEASHIETVLPQSPQDQSLWEMPLGPHGWAAILNSSFTKPQNSPFQIFPFRSVSPDSLIHKLCGLEALDDILVTGQSGNYGSS